MNPVKDTLRAPCKLRPKQMSIKSGRVFLLIGDRCMPSPGPALSIRSTRKRLREGALASTMAAAGSSSAAQSGPTFLLVRYERPPPGYSRFEGTHFSLITVGPVRGLTTSWLGVSPQFAALWIVPSLLQRSPHWIIRPRIFLPVDSASNLKAPSF